MSSTWHENPLLKLDALPFKTPFLILHAFTSPHSSLYSSLFPLMHTTTQLLLRAYRLQNHLCCTCNAGSSASNQPQEYEVLKTQGRWKTQSQHLGVDCRSQVATVKLTDAHLAFQARHPHQWPDHFVSFLVPSSLFSKALWAQDCIGTVPSEPTS